jgi:hypothetical protein
MSPSYAIGHRSPSRVQRPCRSFFPHFGGVSRRLPFWCRQFLFRDRPSNRLRDISEWAEFLRQLPPSIACNVDVPRSAPNNSAVFSSSASRAPTRSLSPDRLRIPTSSSFGRFLNERVRYISVEHSDFGRSARCTQGGNCG